MTLIAVNFHYIRPVFDQPYPAIFGLTPRQFETQLTTLAQQGTFVSLPQIKEAVQGIRPLPERAFLITFDDGLREQFEYALPILDRLGIPAAFFANTDPLACEVVSQVNKIHLLRAHIAPEKLLALLKAHAAQQQIQLTSNATEADIKGQYRYDTLENARLKYLLNFSLSFKERDTLINACFREIFGDEAAISRQLYMDKAMLQQLTAQDSLGTHMHQHLPMATLPVEDVQFQVQQSLKYFETWTGKKPFAASYPYGGSTAYADYVAKELAKCGVVFAFTMERAANTSLEHPLKLARFDTNDMPGGKNPLYPPESLFEQVNTSNWKG